MRHIVVLSLLVFAAVALVIAAAGRAGRQNAEAVGPSAPNQMALDGDLGTAGVQASRTIVGSAPFSVGIDVTQVGSTPYVGYQWGIRFPTAGLALDSFSENTAATGMTDCRTPLSSPGPSDQTVRSFASCDFPFTSMTTSYTGLVTTLVLRCLADGSYTLGLPYVSVDPGGATLVDAASGELDTGSTSATIVCSNVGTPPTATATSVPTSPTPRPPGPNTMSLDAVPTVPGTQSTTIAYLSQPFPIAILLTALGNVPYQAYQWLVDFPDGAFAFVSADENLAQSGMTYCANPFTATIAGGHKRVGGACAANGTTASSSYVGMLTSLNLTCLTTGTFLVSLIDMTGDPNFGTSLFDRVAATITTSVDNPVTVTCAVAPPATATASPTTTATPTSTAAPIRVGGLADVHIGGYPTSASSDGTSDESHKRRATTLTLATAAALSIATCGWYVRRSRRRR